MSGWTDRLISRLVSFDADKAHDEFHGLVATMQDEVVPVALEILKARAVAQDATVGNLRTRATGVLSVAALIVTFTSSVGLLANDTSHGGYRLHAAAAWTLVGLLVLLALATSFVQLPMTWTLDPGTEVFGDRTLLVGQRAALEELEIGVERNRLQIRLLLRIYVGSLGLLTFEVIVLTLDLAVR